MTERQGTRIDRLLKNSGRFERGVKGGRISVLEDMELHNCLLKCRLHFFTEWGLINSKKSAKRKGNVQEAIVLDAEEKAMIFAADIPDNVISKAWDLLPSQLVNYKELFSSGTKSHLHLV